MTLRLKFHTLSCFLLICFLLQISTKGLIAQSFNTDNEDGTCGWNQPEKVYVHLARKIISAGEALPFKAYILNPDTSTQSGIIYFEIIDSSGKSLIEWRSNCSGGNVCGRAIIPESIGSGVYIFRAYTRWMINWGSEFVFQTPIVILNYGDEKISPISKLKYEEASSEDVFLQNHNPKIGIFPKISGDNLSFGFKSGFSTNFIQNYSIVALSHGEKLFSEKLNNQASIQNFYFDLKKSNPGLVTILILNELQKIVQDTVIEYKKESPSRVLIRTDSAHYKRGENVTINIDFTKIPESIQGSFSCSVRMKDSIDGIGPSPTIDNYLNKYSELAASTWYNQLIDKAELSDSANFSWASSIWNKTIDTNECRFLRESDKFLLSGRILDKNSHTRLSNIPVLLSVESTSPSIKYCLTNKKGEFFFWLNTNLDNKTLILQTFSEQCKNAGIDWEIYSGLPQSVKMLFETENLSDLDKSSLKQINDIDLINTIYFSKQENASAPTPEISDNFIVAPNYTVNPNEYDLLTNFQEITENIMPAVSFREKKGVWNLQIFNGEAKVMLKPQRMVLLNGVPFTNFEYIAKLPIEQIDHIDVYTSQIVFGKIDFYGLVAIYTLDKKLPEEIINTETFLFNNRVMKEENEIITGKNDIRSNAPDFRNLLYWNPELILKSGESKTVVFPASDIKGKYIIELQGISNEGQSYSAETEFTIE